MYFSPFRSSRSGRTRPVGSFLLLSGVAASEPEETGSHGNRRISIKPIFKSVEENATRLLPRAISRRHPFESILSRRRARVGKQDGSGNARHVFKIRFSRSPRAFDTVCIRAAIFFFCFSALDHPEALRDFSRVSSDCAWNIFIIISCRYRERYIYR